MTQYKSLMNESVLEDLEYAFIHELITDDLTVNEFFRLDPASTTTFLPTDNLAIEFVNNEISLKDDILVDSINGKNGTDVNIEGSVFNNDTLPSIDTNIMTVNSLLKVDLITDISGNGVNLDGVVLLDGKINADQIDELTTNNGVLIESNLLKDNTITSNLLKTDLITDISLNGVNIDGVVLLDGKINADQIDELTLNNGVLIESNLLKDNEITTNILKTDNIIEKTLNAGTTIDSVLIKDNIITSFISIADIIVVNNNIVVDTINEKIPNSGVTVDSVLLKDNNITANTITANTEVITDTISGTLALQLQNNTTINDNQLIINSPIGANICINSDSNNDDTTDSSLFLQTNGGAIATGISQTANECKFNTSRTDHVFYTDDIVFPTGNNPPTYLVQNERARINSTGLVLPAGKTITTDIITAVGAVGVDIETVNIDAGDITNATLDGIDYSSMTQIQLDYLIALNVVSENGTYAPVVTLISNLDSASISGTTRYTRQGDHVTVWLSVITNNTASGTFSLRVSLPIASSLGQQHDLTGTGWDFPNLFTHVAIRADTANNECFITGQSTLLFNKTYQCQFSYLVL